MADLYLGAQEIRVLNPDGPTKRLTGTAGAFQEQPKSAAVKFVAVETSTVIA